MQSSPRLTAPQLAKVKFGQINWEEPLTGSMIAMPFQKGYQDDMPSNPGPEAAAKILEAAGYSKNGDYYAKDGKTAGFSITYFGSDATSWLSSRTSSSSSRRQVLSSSRTTSRSPSSTP